MRTHLPRFFSWRVCRVALALPATTILWAMSGLMLCPCGADVVDSDARRPESALAKPATDTPADDPPAKIWIGGSGSNLLNEAVVGRAAFERPLLMRDLSVSPANFPGAEGEASDFAVQPPLDAGFHEQEALRAMKPQPIPEAAGQGLACLLFVVGVGLGWRRRSPDRQSAAR